MLFRSSRWLMNEEGAAGGGAGPGSPPASAESQAQGPPAQNLDRPMTIGEFQAERDRMFANLRRTQEAIATKRPAGEPATPQTPPAAPASSGAGMTREDVSRLVRRAGDTARALATSGVSAQAASIIERAVEAEQPEDVSAFVASYVAAFGAASGSGAAPSNPNTTRPAQTQTPVSNAGSPAAPARYTDDTPLVQMSAEDRQHIIKTKGLSWYYRTLQGQLRGTKVSLGNR